jgi:hypothetical protein
MRSASNETMTPAVQISRENGDFAKLANRPVKKTERTKNVLHSESGDLNYNQNRRYSPRRRICLLGCSTSAQGGLSRPGGLMQMLR